MSQGQFLKKIMKSVSDTFWMKYFCKKYNIFQVQHPPYHSDLDLHNFFLFSKLKINLNGRNIK